MQTKAVSRSFLEMNAIPISFPEKAFFQDSEDPVCTVILHCLAWLSQAQSHSPVYRAKCPRWVEVGILASAFPQTWRRTSQSLTSDSNSGPGHVTHLRLPADGTTAWLALGHTSLAGNDDGPDQPLRVMSARHTCAQHLQVALVYG